MSLPECPAHLFGGTSPCLVPPQGSCGEIWGLEVSVPLSVGNLAQQVRRRRDQVAQQGDGFSGRRGETWLPIDIPSYPWAVWEQLFLLWADRRVLGWD